MPATPRKLSVSEEALTPRGTGTYSAIPVPSDQRAKLVDVRDYDKGPGRIGWEWKLDILGCDFSVYTNFNDAARFKLVDTVEAFDPGRVVIGLNDLDPNMYIGMEVGAHIDWQKDPETLAEGESNFREIKYLFSLEGVEEETTEMAEAPAPF